MQQPEQIPSPEDVQKVRRGINTRMRNYALFQFEGIDARTRVALQNLDILDAETEPIGEGVDPDMVRNSSHVQRESLPAGPLILYTVQTPKPARMLLELPVLLLSELPAVRKASLANLEQMIAEGSMEVTPKTRNVMGEAHAAILSDDGNKWRPAAISVYDALNDDVFVALHGVRQSLSCDPVIKDSLNVFTPRVLFPRVSSLDSMSLEVQKPETQQSILSEIVQSTVAEAQTLGDACARYYSRAGHLPLAPPYGMGEVVSQWMSGHPDTDAWTAVWTWARAAFGPVPRYHACSVFVLRPDLIPLGKLAELWLAIMTIVQPSAHTPQDRSEDERWTLRRDLARHFVYHVEAQLSETEGANIACSGWWLAEKVCSLFPDNSESAKFYREKWVKPAFERSALVWLSANPLIGRSYSRYMITVLNSPWGSSLLALMGSKLEALAPFEQSEEFNTQFHEALVTNMVSTLPFPAAIPTTPTYALELSLTETALKWALPQPEGQRTLIEGIVALGRKLGTTDGFCESLRKLAEIPLADQLAVTMSLKAHAYNTPALTAPVWGILSDADWRNRTLTAVDLPILGLLIEAFSLMAVQQQGEWFTQMPHFLAELCEKATDDERRRQLFLYVIHTSLTSDTVSAVCRLLRGPQKAKFMEAAKEYRTQTENLWAWYPPWVQSRLRGLLANMHVV